MWWFKKIFKKEKEKSKTDIDALVEYHKCLDEIEERRYEKSPNYITCDIIKTENHKITIDYNTKPIYTFGSNKCYGINYMNVSICIDQIYINLKKRFNYNDFFNDNKIKLNERLLDLTQDDIDLCFEYIEHQKIDKQKAIDTLKNINGEKILEHKYGTGKFYGIIPIGLRREL